MRDVEPGRATVAETGLEETDATHSSQQPAQRAQQAQQEQPHQEGAVGMGVA